MFFIGYGVNGIWIAGVYGFQWDGSPCVPTHSMLSIFCCASLAVRMVLFVVGGVSLLGVCVSNVSGPNSSLCAS